MTEPTLLDTLTRVIDGYVYAAGPQGPRVAALAVLGQPAIADALHAADVIDRLRALHTPVRWSDDSDTIVCAAACGAWPCRTAEVLGTP